MPEEKAPTESSPTASPPPVEAGDPALPLNRFGPNDPPNAHISRDPPLVLQATLEKTPIATATTIARDQSVSDAFEGVPEVVSFKGSDPEKVLDPGPAPHRLGFSGVGYDVGNDSIAALQPKANNALLSDGFPRFPPGPPPDEVNTGALSNMRESMRAVPLTGLSGARATARAELTLTSKPVTIVPTPYPDDPTSPLVVQGFVHIDTRSAAFIEFSAKIDELTGLLTKSNEIAGDTRDQLLAEIKAGMSILTAPKPDRNLIEALLERPLLWVAGVAGTGIIGGLAYDAVQLLYHMLSQGPVIPL